MKSPMSPATPHQRVLLIGYRGTGKTTVAAHLAEKTKTKWIDTDGEIVRLAGCSIQTLFKREGEIGFRDRETSVLREILAGPCPVIACGGGIVLREENRGLLATAGTTVLLQALPETLDARLREDPRSAAQRPPLTDLESEAEIRAILQQREKLYIQCADLIIETENKTPEQVAEEILEYLPSEI